MTTHELCGGLAYFDSRLRFGGLSVTSSKSCMTSFFTCHDSLKILYENLAFGHTPLPYIRSRPGHPEPTSIFHTSAALYGKGVYTLRYGLVA